MPLKVRPYLSSDFNAWLDLTAFSSIELNEEFLIWNDRPQLPPNSFSFLMAEDQNLFASADLAKKKLSNILMVNHWASRKAYCKSEFSDFINEIAQLTNSHVQIWISSEEMIQYFLARSNVTIAEKRVAFFVEGDFAPIDNDQQGFCDHIYGTCKFENFPMIRDNLPIVKKEFLAPKVQTCLEFSLS